MGLSKHFTNLINFLFTPNFHSVPFKGASFHNLTSNSRPYDYKEKPSKSHLLKVAQRKLDLRYVPFVRCLPMFHNMYSTLDLSNHSLMKENFVL